MIVNDPGGQVAQHAFKYTVWALQGVYFEIVYCASACVIAVLNVPVEQVCVRPSAWIGYHTEHQLPQSQGGTESPTTMRWERGKDWIARGYKPCK